MRPTVLICGMLLSTGLSVLTVTVVYADEPAKIVTPQPSSTNVDQSIESLTDARAMAKKAIEAVGVSKALEQNLKALKLYELHFRHVPPETETLVAYSKVWQNVGECHIEMGRRASGIKKLKTALVNANKAVELSPVYGRAIAQRACLQAELVYSQRSGSNESKSFSDYRQALATVRTLMQHEPDNIAFILLNCRLVSWACETAVDMETSQKVELLQHAVEKLDWAIQHCGSDIKPVLERNRLIATNLTLPTTKGDTNDSLRKMFTIIDSYTSLLESKEPLSARNRILVLNSLATANNSKGLILKKRRKYNAAKMDFFAALAATKAVLEIDPKDRHAKNCRRFAHRQLYLIRDKGEYLEVSAY